MQLEELTVQISADMRGLERGLKQTQTALAGTTRTVTSQTQTLSRSIRTNLGGAIKEINTPLGNLGAMLSQLTGPAGIAALAGGAGFVALKLGAWADTLKDLADSTGVTTDLLQKFELAEIRTGAATGTLADLTERLFTRMGQGDETLRDIESAMAALGIALRSADGSVRSMNEVMPTLIERWAAIEDPAKRAEVGTLLFGRATQALLKDIGDLAQGLREVQDEDVVTPEQLDQLQKFDTGWKKLKVSFRLFTVDVATGGAIVLDWLDKMTRELDTFVQRLFKAGDVGVELGQIVRDATFGAEQPNLETSLRQAGQGVQADIVAAVNKTTDGLEKQRAKLAELRKAYETFQNLPSLVPAPTVPEPKVPSGTGTKAGKEVGENVVTALEAAVAKLRLTESFAATKAFFLDIDLGPDFERLERIMEGARIRVDLQQLPSIFGKATEFESDLVREQQRELADQIRAGGDFVFDSLSAISSDFLTAGQKVTSVLSDLVGSVSSFLDPVGGVIGGIASGIIGFIGGLFGPSETAKRNQAIRDSIDEMFREAVVLGQVPGVEPTIQAFRDLDDEIRNVGVKLKDSGLSVQTAIQAVTDNFEFLVKQFEAGATIQQATDALLEKIRTDLVQTGEGLEGVSQSIQEVADALSNAPEGFKVSLARFNATVAGATAVPGAFGTPAGVPTIGTQFNVEGGITIVNEAGDSGEVLLTKIEGAVMNRQSRGGGGLRLAPTNAPVTG